MYEFASKNTQSPNQPKPPSQRMLKVGEEIRHALADVLMRGEVRHPDLIDTSVTVSEVRMSPDLRNATAYIAPLAGAKKDVVLKALAESAGGIRHLVTKKIILKFSPRISFRLDESFEVANRINDLLHSPEVIRDLEKAGE